MYYSLVLNTIFVAAAIAVPTSDKKDDKKDSRGTVYVPPTLAYCHDSECGATGSAGVVTPGECMPARSGSSWGGFGGAGTLGVGATAGGSFWRRSSHDDDEKDDKKKHKKHDKDDKDEKEKEDDQYIVVAYPNVDPTQQNCPIVVYQTTDCSDSGSVIPGFEGWAAPTFTSGLSWKRGSKDDDDSDKDDKDDVYEVEEKDVYEVEEKDDKDDKKCKKGKKSSKKCKKDKKHKNDKKSSDKEDKDDKDDKKCKKDKKHGKKCKKDHDDDDDEPIYITVPATSGGRPYDVSQWGSLQVHCGGAPVPAAVDPKVEDPKDPKGYTAEPEVEKSDPKVEDPKVEKKPELAYPTTETAKTEDPKVEDSKVPAYPSGEATKAEDPKVEEKPEPTYPTTATPEVEDPKPATY